VLLLIGAALVGAFGLLLLYSYNGAGVLLIGAAIVFVAVALGRYWKVVLLLAAGAICCVATWATLGGGAEEWTALPWALAAAVCLGAAVAVGVRSLKVHAITQTE
jgi:hypothetical protein